MIDKPKLSKRQLAVFHQVQKLYGGSQREIAHWLWKNHVQVVAKNCLELSNKYKANSDMAFAGGLLHDLGDVWVDRFSPEAKTTSELKSKEVLSKAGFSPQEAEDILIQIIGPHSCHPEDKQTLIEGKILATADAMAHLQTNFYHSFKEMGLPDDRKPEEFNAWVNEKLDRDLNKKIFFDEQRELVRTNYEKLKKDFPA